MKSCLTNKFEKLNYHSVLSTYLNLSEITGCFNLSKRLRKFNNLTTQHHAHLDSSTSCLPNMQFDYFHVCEVQREQELFCIRVPTDYTNTSVFHKKFKEM